MFTFTFHMKHPSETARFGVLTYRRYVRGYGVVITPYTEYVF